MSYINSRTINHEVIYSYTVLYGFNQLLTNPLLFFARNIYIIQLFNKICVNNKEMDERLYNSLNKLELSKFLLRGDSLTAIFKKSIVFSNKNIAFYFMFIIR